MGLFELEGRIKRLETKWRSFCCYTRSCLGISSTTGDPDLVLNQQGDWIASGGEPYYLYSENYDSASFFPSTVTGLNAVSIGVNNDVSGDYSTAIGGGNISSGGSSTAIGSQTTASGDYSTAIGEGTNASGDYSTAMGSATTSSGNNSTAIGEGTNASGNYSTAMGSTTTSSGNTSTAMGIGTTASGNYSTAMGTQTAATSFSETALGIINTTYTPISGTTFELTDRLFGVGNGNGSPSDAFTILKNAKVGIDIDNFETTISEAKLQVNGYINAVLNVYANDADADTDTDLKTNDFYKLTGDRTVYQKP